VDQCLILPDWLITNATEAPRQAWGVRVVADRIADVAPHGELRTRYPTDEVWEASHQALSPGFVNAHTHLYGVLAHGIPLEKAPAGFWAFLEDFWWPLVEDRLDHAMICAATAQRCADMLQSGVTAFYDCTEAPNALPGILPAQAEVVRKFGLRGTLSFEATERVSSKNGQLGLKENADFMQACLHDPASLIHGMMCFHTSFTCSADFIRQAFDLAGEAGSLLHMHVSEGTHEPEYALRRFGKRPLQYYEDLGVAGPRMLASQCVQVDETEINAIARLNIRVAHMPLSNCEVGGGIAPIPALADCGVTIGLGSDGYIDDFFEVLRGAFLIHKAYRQDPRVMPADLVWHMATEGGAQALNLEKVGRIETGWQADLQLINLASLPTPLTSGNLFDQLVLYRNASHVEAVWVAGRLLVKEGKALHADLDQIRYATRAAAQRLWAGV
jgi:5-methylthioadenosine/S-adenosylhomocysteine deaminase